MLFCYVQGDLMPVEAYEDVKSLKSLVQRHLKFTGSEVARRILLNWDKERVNFKKVRQRVADQRNPPIAPGMLQCTGDVRCAVCPVCGDGVGRSVHEVLLEGNFLQHINGGVGVHVSTGVPS